MTTSLRSNSRPELTSAQRWGVCAWAALLLLQPVWHAWLMPARTVPVILVLVVTILPLMLPLLAIGNIRRALLWVGILSLFYFCHGVAEAWSSANERWLALVEVLLTLLLIGTLGAGVRRRSDKIEHASSKDDLAVLQGSWEQVAHEADGASHSHDAYGAPGALTTFSGNHFSVRSVEGTLLLEGTFTLDALATPKAITWIDSIGPDRGKKLPASYRLEGDHLIFIAGDEGACRPVVFQTKPGQTMRTFVRKPCAPLRDRRPSDGSYHRP